MKLIMYLGEQLIDEEEVILIGHSRLTAQIIKEKIEQLLEKHKDGFAATDQQPTFYLEGVPSSFNSFRSLLERTTIIKSQS